MALHHIRALLGHASLSTTAIYLTATKVGLRDAMRRVDARRAGRDQPRPMPAPERRGEDKFVQPASGVAFVN